VLNNQLARTTGYADLLANDPDLPAHLRELAEQALSGAEAAAETVTQLRRITHLEETDYGGAGGTVIDLARSTRRPRARASGPRRSKGPAEDHPPV
jgi:hypothetical protein